MSEYSMYADGQTICDHFYAWVSPAGTRRMAQICQKCHQPNPDWLNHIVEVRLKNCPNGKTCLQCEFAEIKDPRPKSKSKPDEMESSNG